MARNLELARLFYRLEMETAGFDRELKGAERNLGRVTDFITKHPVVAAGALGAAFVGVALKAANMARDFEHSMTEVGTLVDKTSVNMKTLSDGVLQLFRSLPVENIEDLTKGLYNVISAGVPASEALNFLRIAAEASVGGVTDVNTAVNGLTSAVNAFGTQGVTATSAADAFFVAVKAGKVTFAEISSSIGNVAGLANGLGVSLDDLLVNMAALTQNGLVASQSFNALKAVLSNVTKPTEKLLTDFPQLAKEFDRNALRAKGLTGFMTDLAEAVKGNGDATNAMFGSVEALNAVMQLTSDGGVKLNKIQDAMAAKAGASSQAFGEMAVTGKNLNQLLRNELTVKFLEFGEKVLPIVNAGLSATLGLLSAVNGLIDAFSEKESALAGIGGTALENMRRLLESPLFGGKLIDLDNLKAGSREFSSLTSAVDAFAFSMRNNVTAALAGSKEQLEAMRATVEAYAKAQVRSLGGTEQERAATVYLGLLKKLDEAIAKLTTSTAGPAASGTGGLTKAQKEARKEFERIAEEAAKKYASAMEQVQEITVATSVTMTDDLLVAIHKLERSLKDAGVSATSVTASLRPLREQLALVKLEERLELPKILEKSADAMGRLDINRLQSARIALANLLRETTAGSKEYKAVQDEIAKVEAIILERNRLGVVAVGEGVKKEQEAIDKRETSLQQFTGIVRKVTDIATAALGAAQAFGLIDSEAARTLQSIISMGEALPRAFAGDPTAMISVIGSLAGVISSLFSGESPEAKAHKELVRKNNAIVAELVAVNGDLVRISQPGAKLEGVEAALRSALADSSQRARGGPRINQGTLSRALLDRGLTIGDLEDVAQAFGFDVRNAGGGLNSEKLEQLLAGLAASETGFNAKSFSDQISRIQSGLRIGAISQEEELSQLLEVAKLSPGILKALAGLDLSTATGREFGAGFLRNLFRDLETPGKVSKADLGGLSQTEFVDLIGQLTALLTSDRTFTGLGVVAGPAAAAVAQDADFYASAVAAADTQISLLEQIVANTRAFNPIAAPVLSDSVTRPGAGALGHTFQISFEAGAFQFGGIPPDPEGFAREVVDRLEQELNFRASLLRGSGPLGGRLDV